MLEDTDNLRSMLERFEHWMPKKEGDGSIFERLLDIYIPIPSGWSIRPMIPFNGAVFRMHLVTPYKEKKYSIYLDWFDRCGYMGQPYWEYYDDEECYRFLLGKEEDMIDHIKRNFMEWLNK